MTDIIRIPDINKYNITIENNELILTPIVTYRIVSEIDIENINLCSSTIMNCNIMNNEEIIDINSFLVFLDHFHLNILIYHYHQLYH